MVAPRSLIAPAALLALTFAGWSAAPLERTVLAEGVTLLGGGPDGNVLVVATAAGSLVVDARSPLSAGELLQALEAEATDHDLPPVRWVVNTHYHEDHRGANEALAADGARLVSRSVTREHMLDDRTIDEFGWTLTPAPAAALPGLTLDGPGALHLGGRDVALIPLPPGHTDGDLAVHLTDVDVLHAGDQVEAENYPFLDIWHGGQLPGLIEGVDLLITRCTEDTVVIPGHGRPVDRTWLRDYRAMLADVLAQVRAALDAGTDPTTFLDGAPTARWDERYGTPDAGRRMAALAYLAEARAREADEDG